MYLEYLLILKQLISENVNQEAKLQTIRILLFVFVAFKQESNNKKR